MNIEINCSQRIMLILMIIMGCPGSKINMAAVSAKRSMLGVKNKSVSFRWELNSIFMQILRKKKCIVLTTNMAVLLRGCKPRIRYIKVTISKRLFLLGQSLFQEFDYFWQCLSYRRFMYNSVFLSATQCTNFQKSFIFGTVL